MICLELPFSSPKYAVYRPKKKTKCEFCDIMRSDFLPKIKVQKVVEKSCVTFSPRSVGLPALGFSSVFFFSKKIEPGNYFVLVSICYLRAQTLLIPRGFAAPKHSQTRAASPRSKTASLLPRRLHTREATFCTLP